MDPHACSLCLRVVMSAVSIRVLARVHTWHWHASTTLGLSHSSFFDHHHPPHPLSADLV